MTSRHLLTATFTGGQADYGHLPPADVEKCVAGARQFLAFHAQFYLTGKTAATGKSGTGLYQINCYPHRQGSFILDLAVNLLGNAVWEAAKYAFGDFVRDSFKAFLSNRLFEEPPYPRIEPYFSPTDKRNAPVFDFSGDIKEQAAQLRRRITHALSLMATPIGRSAESLRICINQVELAVIDRAKKLEMMQAIEDFCRERRQSLQPVYSRN